MLVRWALKILKRAMKKDPEYAWAWHSDIAGILRGDGMPYIKSLYVASNIMVKLFDVSNYPKVLDMEAKFNKLKTPREEKDNEIELNVPKCINHDYKVKGISNYVDGFDKTCVIWQCNCGDWYNDSIPGHFSEEIMNKLK